LLKAAGLVSFSALGVMSVVAMMIVPLDLLKPAKEF